MDTPLKSLPKPKPLIRENYNNNGNKAGKGKKYKTASHLDELFSKKFIL